MKSAFHRTLISEHLPFFCLACVIANKEYKFLGKHMWKGQLSEGITVQYFFCTMNLSKAKREETNSQSIYIFLTQKYKQKI